MRRLFEFGGYAAAVVLVAFGIAALVLGVNGRNEVGDNLTRETIYGGDDMYPAGIAAAVEEAGLTGVITDLPTCSVYDPDKAAANPEYKGELIDTGGEAKCFASYMRIHALESSGGLVYAEMGRFLAAADPADPAGTSNADEALTDDQGKPVPNSFRNTWVTETALSTALNVGFFAEQVSNFSLVVAIALILAGVGFAILAAMVLHRPLQRNRGFPDDSGPVEREPQPPVAVG
jgi:hypothetical protein